MVRNVTRIQPIGDTSNQKEFETWNELRNVIGNGTRKSAKEGKEYTGLGLNDIYVEHLFYVLRRQDDKLCHLDDVVPGLAHLLMAGFGPVEKLRTAFKLSSGYSEPDSFAGSESATSGVKMTHGAEDVLTEAQFIKMYCSLRLYRLKFPSMHTGDISRELGKNSFQVMTDARRLFHQISINPDNKHVTLKMVSRFGKKNPQPFRVMGIELGDIEAYEVPKSSRFWVHANEDIAALIHVSFCRGYNVT